MAIRYHVTLHRGDEVRELARVRTLYAAARRARWTLGPHAKRCPPSHPPTWRAKGAAGEVRAVRLP